MLRPNWEHKANGLEMLTEDEVRYMIALSEKDGALTEDEVRAAAVIEAKVVKT